MHDGEHVMDRVGVPPFPMPPRRAAGAQRPDATRDAAPVGGLALRLIL